MVCLTDSAEPRTLPPAFSSPPPNKHTRGKPIRVSGHRYYSPEIARWLSRDPIGTRGGVNLYGYVGNDAVSSFDALGNIAYYVYGKAGLDEEAVKGWKRQFESEKTKVRNKISDAEAEGKKLTYLWVYKDKDGKEQKKKIDDKQTFLKLLADDTVVVKGSPWQTVKGEAEYMKGVVSGHNNDWDTTGYFFHIDNGRNGGRPNMVDPELEKQKNVHRNTLAGAVKKEADAAAAKGRFVGVAACWVDGSGTLWEATLIPDWGTLEPRENEKYCQVAWQAIALKVDVRKAE